MAILPDVIKPGLRVVFCGSAAGERSAATKSYYAGRGNKFWPIIHEIGLTPRLLKPHEFWSVLEYGIGLTDLVKNRSGSDAVLRSDDFDVARLHALVIGNAPAVLAFNGKRAAQVFFGGRIRYGQQPQRVGSSIVFVLPSTSMLAQTFWDEAVWYALAAVVKQGDGP